MPPARPSHRPPAGPGPGPAGRVGRTVTIPRFEGLCHSTRCSYVRRPAAIWGRWTVTSEPTRPDRTRRNGISADGKSDMPSLRPEVARHGLQCRRLQPAAAGGAALRGRLIQPRSRARPCLLASGGSSSVTLSWASRSPVYPCFRNSPTQQPFQTRHYQRPCLAMVLAD